jgi:phage shock protein E
MKNSLSIITLIVASIFMASCVDAQNRIAMDVSVKEFKRFIENKPGTLLDVRTKGEVSKGAIKGSTHIDFFDEAFETRIEALDKTKPVYVYCAAGGRSGEAMDLMKKKGFTEIYNLRGGYNAWVKENR